MSSASSEPSSSSESPANPATLATWVRADASRPYCARPWNQVTVLSDGTAVCACVDAEKTNPLGSFQTQSFDEIWNGPRYRGLRRAIQKDIDAVPICRGCPNRIASPPPGNVEVESRPQALFLESYAGCNLECPGCNREGIEGSRSSLALDFETYAKVIEALSPGLRYMEFHLGGENYMHKRASEMVALCKRKNPGCFVLSSTNGHFFHDDARAREAIESGVDCLVLSIDGARQESYQRYRVNGRLERVLDGARRLVRLKKELGRERPLLIWRYILFEWNDSKEEMDEARALARDVGVDHLAWHLNAVDGQSASPRYHVGSPHLPEIEHELWDTLPRRVAIDIGVDFSAYAR